MSDPCTLDCDATAGKWVRDVLEFVAEAGRVRGDVRMRDGVLFLRTDPPGIERLR
ncbi:MAG: hypothetical protein IH985_00995 [Planctomycetes bacterium]|nr:hypothetical protein [Planctomycetota bacterium]